MRSERRGQCIFAQRVPSACSFDAVKLPHRRLCTKLMVRDLAASSITQNKELDKSLHISPPVGLHYSVLAPLAPDKSALIFACPLPDICQDLFADSRYILQH